MAAARLWEKEPVNFNKTLAKIETLLDEDKLDQILALALELGFNAAWLAPAKAAPPTSEQSARSTTQTAMAASSDMVCAAPLGPVDCYEWFHEGRASAELFLEKTVPFRIFFRTFDGHGVVQSESGWHGSWYQDVCTGSITYRNRCGGTYIQTAGDIKLTLDGFRYLGMDAEWTHNDMTFEKKVDDDTWYLTSCGCGTKHRIVFRLKDSAAGGWVDPDVTPGPSVIDGFYTR